MMGKGHATLGVAAWCVAAPMVVTATGNPISAGTLILGAIPVAGASLIPDIDHPNGSIANSAGPITRGIAKGAAALSAPRGHPHLTVFRYCYCRCFSYGVGWEYVGGAGLVFCAFSVWCAGVGDVGVASEVQ